MTAIEPTATYARTERTTPSRYPARATYERDAVHAVLDEALVCHVGYIVDECPVIIPTLHVRKDDRIYLHGSTGSRLMLRAAAGPVPVCVTVTLTDGLVLAKSWFNHSINYRCVIAHGEAELVTDPTEKWDAMVALMDHVARGRAEGSRGANKRELAATAILRLPLGEVSLKLRSGSPKDDDSDIDLPFWSGVIPVTTVFGDPEPSDDVPLPGYLAQHQRC